MSTRLTRNPSFLLGRTLLGSQNKKVWEVGVEDIYGAQKHDGSRAQTGVHGHIHTLGRWTLCPEAPQFFHDPHTESLRGIQGVSFRKLGVPDPTPRQLFFPGTPL